MNEYALPTYGNRYPRGAVSVACMYTGPRCFFGSQLASYIVAEYLLSSTY